MTLRIDHESEGFPGHRNICAGTLCTSWRDLIWAAITVGRPSKFDVFKHGSASLFECVFRWAIVHMAVEKNYSGRLKRTAAFRTLDPTEKGMIGYFLGMTLCKLFAAKLLKTDWLLHLDIFSQDINIHRLGRSRPDLVGKDFAGKWHAFECKGRSGAVLLGDKKRAKNQAQRVVSVDGARCDLHVGSFAFFRSDILQFYWRDPEPEGETPIELPLPERVWKYYYEPAFNLATRARDEVPSVLHESVDFSVEIHPEIEGLLGYGRWDDAHKQAVGMREELLDSGYQADGLRVVLGDSWNPGRME